VSTWHDLVTASLIGTERSVVPPAGIPGLLPAEDDTGDPAAVLLDRAALLTAARRAGRRPDRAEPLPVCRPDPRPAVSPAAGRRLARMLGGEYPELLAEWLAAVADRGLQPPPQSLPALLDLARRTRSADSGLARLVAAVGGPRARWLAGLNPDWDFAAEPTPTGQDTWRLGDASQRRDYLAALLATKPDAARDLIRGGWSAATPAERVMFLSVLAGGLGPADEPLLEAALDDRSGDVSSRAADLLASLPGSALGQRMAERALRFVRIEYGVSGPRLVITPPADSNQLGRGRLILEVVARAPLRTWTDRSGLTAAQVAALPSGDWAPVLFTGWVRAAIAQRDHEWAAALIGHALTGRPPRMPGEIQALAQLARRADPALGAPDTLPEPGPDAPPVVGVALRVLRFRYDMMKELSDDGHDSRDGWA
jgi:Family of unknown function (DUF5691)